MYIYIYIYIYVYMVPCMCATVLLQSTGNGKITSRYKWAFYYHVLYQELIIKDRDLEGEYPTLNIA